MQEIERKFLVKSEDYKQEASQQYKISQGYLNSHPDRSVRVRIKGEKGYLTIKGKSSESGMSRFEWEKEVDLTEAEELLKLCEPGVIEKIRYLVNHKGNLYEIDEFSSDNEGLVVAEIELESEESEFQSPGWLGKEVTGDNRYYNSQLCQHPFKDWKNKER